MEWPVRIRMGSTGGLPASGQGQDGLGGPPRRAGMGDTMIRLSDERVALVPMSIGIRQCS